MANKGISTKDISVPRIIKKHDSSTKPPGATTIINGGPTMKGNIGPTIKNVDTMTGETKKLFSKLAEAFDIDKVINKEDRKNEVSFNIDHDASVKSFDLSNVHDYEMDSNKFEGSSDEKGRAYKM